MNPESDEFRHFPQPDILVTDDVAHPFSSPIHAETVNRPLNDLPGVFNSSLYSNTIFENSQSIELDDNIKIINSNNDIETKIIQNDNDIQEHHFDNDLNQEKILFIEELHSFDINQLDLIIQNLNEKFKYLQIECERTQRITTHFEK